MINTQYLIVGQGICGTFLSWYLERENASYLVIDNNFPASSSRVAAGVINPVTGRRIVKTWMIDTLLPFAQTAYKEIESSVGGNFFSQTAIANLFPTPQMRNAFTERVQENAEFLKLSTDDHQFAPWLEYHFGHGEISPSFVVQLSSLTNAWRRRISALGKLFEEEFSSDRLLLDGQGITYKDIRAEKIIFCDGVASAGNPFFKNLPFALNKGEALIIKCDALPHNYVFKKAITLVPMGNGFFWAGASHEWEYNDALPTPGFLEVTSRVLKKWLKVPFTIEDHVAAIRPATLERRPFAGVHPHLPNVGILNGMGTKGCSLAPYFARQLVDHLTKKSAILPQADISRFTRILQP